MSKIKNIVKVMNIHSLLRVDKSRKVADQFLVTENELTNLIDQIYFNENMCHYGLTINRGSYTKHQTHDWLELTKTKASKLEVIGNIYDNPELLEETTNVDY